MSNSTYYIYILSYPVLMYCIGQLLYKFDIRQVAARFFFLILCAPVYGFSVGSLLNEPEKHSALMVLWAFISIPLMLFIFFRFDKKLKKNDIF